MVVNTLVNEFGGSVVNAELETLRDDFEHEGINYELQGTDDYSRGRVVQYANTEAICYR